MREALTSYIEATYHLSHPKAVGLRRALLMEGGVAQTPFIESTPAYVSRSTIRLARARRTGPRFSDQPRLEGIWRTPVQPALRRIRHRRSRRQFMPTPAAPVSSSPQAPAQVRRRAFCSRASAARRGSDPAPGTFFGASSTRASAVSDERVGQRSTRTPENFIRVVGGSRMVHQLQPGARPSSADIPAGRFIRAFAMASATRSG